ncbi:MAG: accessory factor UbiK family protein [Gammaproteobacteria bacterium]
MELPNKEDIDASIQQAIQQAVKLIPNDMTRFREDVEKNLKSTIQATFSKFDLVSREEFDIQTELLSRTRALVEELEKKISDMEQTRNT